MQQATSTGKNSSDIPREAPTRTLEKGLFVLNLFDVDHPEWTLRELRERAGLSKATTRRLVRTLESSGWLAYDPILEKYHLGSSALKASYLAMSHSELVRLAHPILARLTETTTESTSLTVWADRGSLIIDTVLTERSFKPFTTVGMLLSGHASADAQILIAFGPEHVRKAVLESPRERRTPFTLIDEEDLKARWDMVRREGVAFDRSEWKEDAPAVAAPVFGRGGELKASISVVTPPERFTDEQAESYAKAVREAAAELSAALRFEGA